MLPTLRRRAGVVALSLGAGLGAAAVIALGGSGSASAAPANADSAGPASTESAGPASTDSASFRAAGQPRSRTGPKARAAVVPAAPGPAARTRSAATEPQARASRIRTAAPERAVRPAPPAVPAGTDARAAGTQGRLITIYKGTHFVIPNQWALWVREDSGSATFTAASSYDLKDEDQYDWNKLAGITFTPWRPDRNSMMVVWRYNLRSETYEVGPFYNVDFGYVFPTPDEIITVPAGATFGFHVDYDGIAVSYGDRSVYKARPQDLSPSFWTSARVTGWFGGNEVAPRTISYYLRLD